MDAVRQSTSPVRATESWLDIFPYGNIIEACRVHRLQPTYSTPSPSPVGDRLSSCLRRGALAVGTLVVTLGLPQPAVSKHLGVLRKVGVVAVIKQGKQRVYNLEAEKLKTVHDWVKAFEELWGHQLDRIKERAEQRAREQTESPTPLKPRKGQS